MARLLNTEPMEARIIRLREEALEWREVEGEIVALDLRAQTYLAINRSGAAIWAMLAAGSTFDGLVSKLMERFDVDRQSAAVDVNAFLDELEEHDLLERIASS